MPFGLDFKALLIGAALGYFVIPRLVGPVMGAVAEARGALDSE